MKERAIAIGRLKKRGSGYKTAGKRRDELREKRGTGKGGY